MLALLPPGPDSTAAAGEVLMSGTPDDVSSAVEALASSGWLLSAALRLDEQVWQVRLRPRSAPDGD